MRRETIQQVADIVSFYDRQLKEANHNEKIAISCVLNRLEARGEKLNWRKKNPGFMDAIEKIKRDMKLKNTIYELYCG